MQIRFLSIDFDEAFLLGYRLKLSKTEQRLLYEIAKGGKCGVARRSNQSILKEISPEY